MAIKPTIIGASPASAGGKAQSTSVGDVGTRGAGREAPAAMTSTMRPTAFKPTALPGTAHASDVRVAPTSIRPTAVSAQPAAPAPSAQVRASVIPGVQRKPLEVSHTALAARFPGADAALLECVRARLIAVSLHALSAPAALAFGKPEQEDLASLVKDRLSLMERAASRGVTQHLARMHTLLTDVLSAMDGGFFRRSAAAVWASVSGEVQQLEGLLANASPALSTLQGSMAELSSKATQMAQDLEASSLAAQYLADVASTEIVSLLVSRATSLVASQALALEQVSMLALDTTKVQELTTLVQDGVLLQLPAVYSQLAGLTSKPSDTQRYLATEKLNEIVTIMQRKL